MSDVADNLKRQAAVAAVGLVTDGMLLGLGTGSTAAHFVAEIGARLAGGSLRGVRGVPTSEATRAQASRLGVPLVDLPAEGVDLAVDGMDELNGELDAVKGLGGALLREKIVAAAAKRFVLIGDDSKLVDHLGQKAPLPVEVARFGSLRTLRRLQELAEATLRTADGEPFLSDNDNYVVDCRFAGPFDAREVGRQLGDIPGVLGHGLFLGLAHEAIVAGAHGVKRIFRGAAGGVSRAGTDTVVAS